jgi:hypothetical protein
MRYLTYLQAALAATICCISFVAGCSSTEPAQTRADGNDPTTAEASSLGESASKPVREEGPTEATTALKPTTEAPLPERDGEALWCALLDRHPSLHPFYKRAVLWGAISPSPLAIIHVVDQDWKDLSEPQKRALERYARSRVKAIRDAPLDYCNVPNANLSITRSITLRAKRMTDKHWGIMVGRLSPDGLDIAADRIVRSGLRR